MKKIMFTLLLAAAGALAQTTPVNLSLTVPNNVILDLYTWSHTQFNDPQPMTLIGAIGTADTTLTLNSTNGLPPAGTVFIDSEAIVYTGISGITLTGLSRGIQQTAAAAHADGVVVHVLQYATLNGLLKTFLQREVAKVLNELGVNSQTLSSLMSQQATVNQQIQNALTTAVQ